MHHNPIIWTRSATDWESDKLFFKGFNEVTSIPCIQTKVLSDVKMPTQDPKLCVFTSNKAIGFLVDQPFLQRRVIGADQVYCLSLKQKTTLQKLGVPSTAFSGVQSASALFEKIVAKERPQATWVIGGEQLAFNSVSFLKNKNFMTSHIVLYETRPVSGIFDTLKKAFRHQDRKLVVCFASPSAVKSFADQVPISPNAHPSARHLGSKILCLCIGETTSQEARRHYTNTLTSTGNGLRGLARDAKLLQNQMVST